MLGIVLSIVVLIFSVIVHEISHGLAAFLLGDPTAKYAGRLTLNPISHLDLWGSFVVPALLIFSGVGVVFGWAKPVPYNPYNLRDQKYGPAMVGAAGPLSNLVLALIAGVCIRILLVMGVSESLLVFNVLAMFIYINILLLVFNLLPIPPLDGSKLLFTFLPISEHTKAMLDQYGFIVLFVFIFMFSSIIGYLMNFVLSIFNSIVVGVNIYSFL
ncbi:MAG: site-2 protease family protein [Patescibacteria group bacterium]|jgi:Zn-dependent protease|nr:site-2 protease family protein [Patescibacteria group bacterium]